MVEQAYVILYIISNIIGLYTITSQYGIQSKFVSWFFVVFLSYILVYYFYKITKGKMPSSQFKIDVNIRKLHVFVFVLIIATIMYSAKSGYGVAESIESTTGSQFFSVLNIHSIIYFYYVIGRRKTSKLYWFNIILYVILRLLQGYTSVLFTFFIFETYFRLRGKKWYDTLSRKKILLIFGMELFVIVCGGALYSILRPLKYTVRGVQNGFVSPLSIMEGIEKLVQRFSIYPSVAKASMFYEEIIEFYQTSVPFAEIQSFLRPLLPRRLMPFKEFYNMGSCIAAVPSGLYNLGVSDSVGVVMHAKLLFDADVVTFMVWFCVYFLSIYFIRKAISLLQKEKKEFDIVYFVICLSFITTGNIETLFAQSYAKLLFFFPVLLILGIVKLKKRSF